MGEGFWFVAMNLVYFGSIVIIMLFSGEINLDGLMTTLITAVEEHNMQLEREIQEEVCAQQ